MQEGKRQRTARKRKTVRFSLPLTGMDLSHHVVLPTRDVHTVVQTIPDTV